MTIIRSFGEGVLLVLIGFLAAFDLLIFLVVLSALFF